MPRDPPLDPRSRSSTLDMSEAIEILERVSGLEQVYSRSGEVRCLRGRRPREARPKAAACLPPRVRSAAGSGLSKSVDDSVNLILSPVCGSVAKQSAPEMPASSEDDWACDCHAKSQSRSAQESKTAPSMYGLYRYVWCW